MKSIISIIAALAENRVIGNKGEIPWHISVDFKRFKSLTLGHPVIMGRTTFASIGKPLPGRTNIVITHNASFSCPGCLIVHSLEDAIEIAKRQIGSSLSLSKGNFKNPTEIFIIGGAQIYQQAMKYADKLYLTIVHKTVEGDAFFPDYSQFSVVLYKEEGEEKGVKFTFLELKLPSDHNSR